MGRYLQIITYITLLTFSLPVLSYEKADSFVVKVYDEKVRVLSPNKYDPLLKVVIENKTLSKITGKVETGSGEVLAFISILPSKFTSVSVKSLKSEKVYFVPLSPPLQKVELKIGNKPYEIPPKQKGQ